MKLLLDITWQRSSDHPSGTRVNGSFPLPAPPQQQRPEVVDEDEVEMHLAVDEAVEEDRVQVRVEVDDAAVVENEGNDDAVDAGTREYEVDQGSVDGIRLEVPPDARLVEEVDRH